MWIGILDNDLVGPIIIQDVLNGNKYCRKTKVNQSKIFCQLHFPNIGKYIVKRYSVIGNDKKNVRILIHIQPTVIVPYLHQRIPLQFFSKYNSLTVISDIVFTQLSR